MRTFRSDNNSGLCPEALRGLLAANDGSHEIGYGDDRFTIAARGAFEKLFGEATVYFVATGTAANVLSVAALTEPWQKVLCHRHSHYNADESTAPERLTGCRAMPVESHPHKLTTADVERAGAGLRGDVHEPAAGVVTISNVTEFGTLYTLEEVRSICSAAHAHGFRVHMDGARFANAVAALGCTPRELTTDAGVDALSFGGTKNGLACGEAVVFLPQGDRVAYDRAVATFEFHRKSTGHLLSKLRFVSAPFAAVLGDGSWLRHATHSNRMAARLSRGLVERGLDVCFPTEANGVFVRLPQVVDTALEAQGHGYYPFGDIDEGVKRLMCSFDTEEEEVDRLLSGVAAALESSPASHD